MKAGELYYSVESLEELAQFFEKKRRDADQIALREAVLREKRYYHGQSFAYEHIVSMLRNLKIEGKISEAVKP